MKIKEKIKVKLIQNQVQIKIIESNKGVDNKSRKISDGFSNERMIEIKYLSKQIDHNNLTYYFKDKSNSPINFIGFKAPLHLNRNISNGKIELTKAEEDQEQFKSDLNKITRGNRKKKKKHQIKTIKNIKNLYELRKKVIKMHNDSAKITSGTKYKAKYGEGLLTSKQMLQRLPKALA